MSTPKHTQKDALRVVAAVLRNVRGEVLCALRSNTMSSPGLWEFPGGKIKEGESPQETLQREIEEELDCVVEVGRLLADTVECTPSGLLIRLQTYEARLMLGQPHAREHAKLLWLPIPYLSSLNWSPPDLPTLEVLQQEVGR